MNCLLRITAALTFVPVRFVRPVWQTVKVAAQQLPHIKEFIRYFEDTWLVGNFPLIMWSVYQSGLLQNQQPPWGVAWLSRMTVWRCTSEHLWICRSGPERADSNWIVVYIDGNWSTPFSKSLESHIKRYKNFKNVSLQINYVRGRKYVHEMSAHNNVCIIVVLCT